MHPSTAHGMVHTLKVILVGVKPPVWRRLQVPSAITLGRLDQLLRTAFDWGDDHLHGFEHRGARYQPAAQIDPFGIGALLRRLPEDEDEAVLEQVVPRAGDVLTYTYDFGDDWQHRIEVQHIGAAEPETWYPRCLEGSGMPPMEDSEQIRPGRFDHAARAQLDRALQHHGGASGCDLPAPDPSVDRVFAGVFTSLRDGGAGPCPCGCGEPTGPGPSGALPMLDPAPDEVLAELALSSALVQRSLALTEWLGTGRSLTPSQVLRPADALAAVAELALHPLLDPARPNAAAPGAGSGSADTHPGVDEDLPLQLHPILPERSRGVAPAKVRSAKDLPDLHPIWAAAVAADLIEVSHGKARPGPAIAFWREPGDARQRVQSWATMLAGYLRAREDQALADRSYRFGPIDEVLPASAPLLYALARQPMPAAVLAVALAGLDDDTSRFALRTLTELLDAVTSVANDWMITGVVDLTVGGPLTGEGPLTGDGPLTRQVAELSEQLAEVGADLDAGTRQLVGAVIDALVHGPVLQLTPLGSYGLARLLRTSGWEVPRAGGCIDVAAMDLLDRLADYSPDDAVAEASRWLDARRDSWEAALLDVGRSAAVKGDDGPVRREVLQAVLLAAGPRVAPLIRSWRADRWLSSVAASTAHRLGVGPEPTLAQRLWLEVDSVSLALDAPSVVAELLADSLLIELLASPGGVRAAVALEHPQAGVVLRAVLPLVNDPVLARDLRKELARNSSVPRSWPVRRKAGSARRRNR